jgi:DNA adenine methylase
MSAAPVLKWTGGKRQLLPQLLPRLPRQIATYYEPFVGGGALFFALANAGRFKRAVIADANADLINVYRQVRDKPVAVLVELRKHARAHCEKHFYTERELLIGNYGVTGAARLIYLNQTCFNGLYRVNKAGKFNVSFGRYAKPRIVDVEGIERASMALQGVEILHSDFADVVTGARTGDACYFDPPYIPASKGSNFTAFHSDGFGIKDQERLAKTMLACAARGAYVLLSNSDTLESRRIYGVPGNTVEVVGARRNINSKASARGAVGEILVSVPGLVVKKGRAA